MATETPLLIANNVIESYPEGHETTGTLTISLVGFKVGGNPSGNLSTETYLDLTLPSGANLPVPASTRVWQPTPTSFSIELSESTLEYLLEATGDMVSPQTILDFAQASAPNWSQQQVRSFSETLETVQSIFAQYAQFAHPEMTPGSLVLVAEEDGSPVANLKVDEPIQPLPNDKSPVVVEVIEGGARVSVRPATEEEQAAIEAGVDATMVDELPKAYRDDKLIGAAVGVSRGLVYASQTLAHGLNKAADWYTYSRPVTETPLVFEESTKKRVHRVAQVSGTGAKYTRKASSAVQNLAAGLGERMTKKREAKAGGKNGSSSPSLLNRSLVAFSTVMDGLDTATQTVVNSAAGSSAKVVGHAYGPEARGLAEEVGRSVTHVAAVYVDVRGVSRKAIVKGFTKGAVRGVVSSGGDGGEHKEDEAQVVVLGGSEKGFVNERY
ncbi:uncharacterized protein SAPINGB_P004337 [Magnusiomyces paraingens]|uniref:Senescence domain-containing protein n=1 Tax=Magnusiomyces paraingens TaxID=2606893 RepID=A0A5E8BZC4_9ASCO|nr:uncharacterized protein SAPINGB_P004337 [Saprochaete ingens]VVT54937.1 unnamed protein product [Saprochaete ingens]